VKADVRVKVACAGPATAKAAAVVRVATIRPDAIRALTGCAP
jgi:hypothetical protein